MKKGILPIITVILLLVITGCEKVFEDKHHERFEDPPWLDGSILKTLQDDTTGFDIFLALMDRAGYTDKMERGIYSLFVANDESYREYFNSILELYASLAVSFYINNCYCYLSSG